MLITSVVVQQLCFFKRALKLFEHKELKLN